MANLGFENEWQKIGGNFQRTDVGDKFIYEKITTERGDLGGEQSGHILSRINNYSGDGILTAIQIASYCNKKKITLKDWLQTSFSPFPQKLTNISTNISKKEINNFLKKDINNIISKTTQNSIEPCRIFVRPSGTEPVLRILVEAENNKLVNYISKVVTAKIQDIIS